MAITVQCSRCEHKQKIDDDMASKEVPCKICHNMIKPQAAKTKSAVAGDAKKEVGVKAGTPGSTNGKTKSGGPPPVKGSKAKDDDDDDDEPRAKKKRAKDDDDDDDDRPTPKKRRDNSESSGSGMMMLVLIGGGLFMLAMLCGGGALGAYFTFVSEKKAEVPLAQINDPAPQPVDFPNPNPKPFPNPNPNPNPFPNPNPNPFPNPNPNPNPPPNQGALDPNEPKHIEKVIPILQGPENERGPAYVWLNAANENHGRRQEVAKLLEDHVNIYIAAPPAFGNDGLFNAFFKWSTVENVPAIANVVEKTRFTVWDNRYKEDAMKKLGKLKDPRGVDVVAKQLGNAFFGNGAAAALTEMGTVAEPTLLKSYNHPDGNARNEVRRILLNLKTNPDSIMTQCIADLDSADNNRRNAAVQYFATTPVDAKRRPEVAKGLNKNLLTANFFFEKDLIKVLETWGTADNVPTLVQRLEANKTGNNETIQILAKIRDPNGMKAVAKSMSNFFNQGEAKKALKEYGAGAEVLVIEQMNLAQDAQAKKAYVQFLGEIGTRAVSLPALQQLAFRNQQDRFLVMDIATAQKTIFARGK